MSYHCGVCGWNIPDGKSMLRYVIRRPDGNIAREIPVCKRCKTWLNRGADFDDLIERFKSEPEPEIKPVLAVIVPTPTRPESPVSVPLKPERITFGKKRRTEK